MPGSDFTGNADWHGRHPCKQITSPSAPRQSTWGLCHARNTTGLAYSPIKMYNYCGKWVLAWKQFTGARKALPSCPFSIFPRVNAGRHCVLSSQSVHAIRFPPLSYTYVHTQTGSQTAEFFHSSTNPTLPLPTTPESPALLSRHFCFFKFLSMCVCVCVWWYRLADPGQYGNSM